MNQQDFIFEKIGSKYQYILIDEFQDTSTLQWNNLIPLVHESLSVGGQNLIAVSYTHLRAHET